jgi:hypothetical protein
MQTRITLSPKVLTVVLASPSVRTEIAAAIGIHTNTVANWAKANNPKLAHPMIVNVLKRKITLPKGEKYTIEEKISEAYLINE